ncbi:MAG: DUF4011 domain-containing protein [Treponema sp.]|nr:DUF4011 domain-containing protein [Treponema sp.]
MKLETRLNDWKRKLLDLGKRNGLINFKPNSKSILCFLKPSMKELWKTIVEEEKSIEFPYITDQNEEDEIDDTITEYKFGYVSTNRKPKDAQKILRSLRKKYKTFVDEQNVNVLYLSFGFLEWTEVNSSHQTLISPLILVPVSLQCESIKDPMVLRITEDEIVINPTLAYKLNHDFGVELPEFQDEDISTIYSKLQTFAAENKWTIKDDVCLSILSFLKINMYKDLEKHKNAILSHPIINALGGNTALLENTMDMQNISDIDGYDHDSVNPMEVYNVVDADSSQQDAILCASRDVSFVLQGPPGTGKSQTITNIIASKIAEGKKVLFVSEKKAALDVVYKRLKDVGLSDFCLTLHSNKANKKETLTQLENVLTLSRNKANMSSSVQYKLDKLIEDREKLNKYAKEVNEIIEPLGKSIFYANGVIAKYADIEDFSFHIPNVRQTSEQQYRDLISVLNNVSNQIKRMNDDCSTNPWRHTTVQLLTHEFRHDFGEQKAKITEGIDNFNSLCKLLTKNDKLNAEMTLEGMKKLRELLAVAKETPEIPSTWLEEVVLKNLKKNIETERSHKEDFLILINKVKDAVKEFKRLNGTCSFEFESIQTSEDTNAILENIKDIISSNTSFNALKSDISKIGFIAQNENTTKQYLILNSDILDNYNEDIYSIDTKAMEMRFKYNYNTVLRIIKPSFWKDKKLLKQLAKNKKTKLKVSNMLQLLENISKRNELLTTINEQKQTMLSIFPLIYKELDTDFELIEKEVNKFNEINKSVEALTQIKIILKNLEKKNDELKQLFNEEFNGINTDWNEIQDSVNWLDTFKSLLANYDDTINNENAFLVNTCSKPEYSKHLKEMYNSLNEYIENYSENIHWFAYQFENSEEIISLDFEKYISRLNDCSNNFEGLENWIDYSSSRKKFMELGLTEFLNTIENKTIPSDKIIPVFEKRFYRLWIDSVLPEYTAVASFRHVNHEELIKEFSDLDKQQLSIAQARIKANLINALPALDTFTSGEVNILKKELAKQRKIMPIRKLFAKIPNLIMTLKPCLMMSPLSVSQFLESECYKFDTIIFDEASQVKTENAIGAIFRGKQIIIAGDSHQLPPTNFFNVQSIDDEFDSDEYDENESLDISILEEALFLPNRELLWHYRSRHEHLIAFSNAKIYKNRLVTFPSNTDKVPDWGVEYIYVENGVYNGKGNPRGNSIEAERVAKEVFAHIKKYPNRTLGVITFGVVQELAIENAINKMRKEHPEYEEFFVEDKLEAFFVKSLENVQGDERDTIILSIGYAKDSTGKMAMRFGPLSQLGGERRLNVAITRAKYNIKLIGSIMPTDIDIDRVSQDGPKLLRKYIAFAMNGPDVILKDIDESKEVEIDSPFESSVYEFLNSKGYKVVTKVGCSGYKIDLGIKHPKYSGVFVLGIECDGATYHSSRTARERDRLRQDILEMMGWKIYRIWSTDWIKDLVNEKQRLLQAIENAINSFNSEFIGNSNLKDNKKKIDESEVLIQFEQKTNLEEQDYGFEDYKICKVKGRLSESDSQELRNVILKIVEIEEPISFEVLCQRVCPLFNRQKVTSVIQNIVKKSLTHLLFYKKIYKSADFLYFNKEKKAPRIRLAASRQINQIAYEELAEGMLIVLDNNIGLTKEDLIHETARAFGFNRIGKAIIGHLEDVVKDLEIDKKIEIKDEKIIKI